MRIINLTHAVFYTMSKLVFSPLRRMLWSRKRAPFVFTTPSGRKFRLYPDQTIDGCIFVDGAYEVRILEVVERFFRQRSSAVMLDVGANIGNHAIYLSNAFSRIICFEPSPYIALRLKNNIALNNLENVEVHAIGLSNQNAILQYKLDTSGNLGASHFISDVDQNSMELPVRCGDTYLTEMSVDRIDFIKVDVENHELAVFEGLAQTILNHRPMIIFEFHGTTQGLPYFDAIKDILIGYIFTDATFAPAKASNFEKFAWQVRQVGRPRFIKIDTPEPRFYENIVAFPDSHLLSEFEKANC